MGIALALVVAVPLEAHAQVRQAALARMKLLNKKAMDEYDGLEFESAKTILLEALSVAKGAGVAKGPTLVTVYLNLGVVYGAGLNDRATAVKYFTEALRVDRTASLDPSRSTPVLEEMFKSAHDNLGPEPAPEGGGFQHTPLDEAAAGHSVRVRAKVGEDVGAKKVTLYFRGAGSSDFESVPMEEVKPGIFAGVIPAERVAGRSVLYYVAAEDESGKRLAGHGSANSPNVISVRAGSGDGGKVEPPKPPRSKLKRFSLGVMIGTGVGLVYGGKSEHDWPMLKPDGNLEAIEVGPGFALAAFHLAPEIAVAINERWQISVLGRIQVVNALANTAIEGVRDQIKGSISGLAMLRAKVFFGEGALRGYFSFGGGGGNIRHRIPLGDYDRNQDMTDSAGNVVPDPTSNNIVDSRVAGPGVLGIGGGLRYMFHPSVGIQAELNALILVPTFAANLDLNTGMVFCF